MSRLFELNERAIFFITGVLVVVAVAIAWPLVAQYVISTNLARIYSEQSKPLLQPVADLLGSDASTPAAECYERSHDYTQVKLDCEVGRTYTTSVKPRTDASRAEVLAKAKALDAALNAQGWVADRQQDAVKTVADAVPSAPLASFHSISVPFHKNIGSTSCNLEVFFTGPSDGVSPGMVDVNRFSCQQNASYFMPHPTVYKNNSFGG